MVKTKTIIFGADDSPKQLPAEVVGIVNIANAEVEIVMTDDINAINGYGTRERGIILKHRDTVMLPEEKANVFAICEAITAEISIMVEE